MKQKIFLFLQLVAIVFLFTITSSCSVGVDSTDSSSTDSSDSGSGGSGGDEVGMASKVSITGSLATSSDSASKTSSNKPNYAAASTVLAGAEIQIVDEAGNVVGSGTTDSQGNYMFEVEPGGPYFIRGAQGNIALKAAVPTVSASIVVNVNTDSTAIVQVMEQKLAVKLGEEGVNASTSVAAYDLNTLVTEILNSADLPGLITLLLGEILQNGDLTAPTTTPTLGANSTEGAALAAQISVTIKVEINIDINIDGAGSGSDTGAPGGASVTINNGASETDSVDVLVALAATDDTGVMAYFISEDPEDPGPTSFGWVLIGTTTSYSSTVPFKLSPAMGLKTVYAWFRDGVGNISTSVNSTIKLTDGTTPAVINGPPIADFSASSTNINIGQSVTLDGSNSSDPEGGAITYLWSLETPGGSSDALGSTTGSTSSFTANNVGSYIVTLRVKDPEGAEGTNSVTITVADPNANTTNNAPTASLTRSDLNGVVGQTVYIDGSNSSDPDGDGLVYEWLMYSQPGIAVLNSSTSSSQATFVPDVAGPHIIHLTVSDGQVNSNTAEWTVNVQSGAGNTPPVADSSASDQSGVINNPVTLNGSNSTDADGNLLTFYWTITPPTTAAFSLPSTANPVSTFTPTETGNFSIDLLVSDGQVNSLSVNFSLSVSGGGGSNSQPVANASASDTTGIAGTSVTLDGSLSSDPDGDSLTYFWTISPPSGSPYSLPSTTSATSTFVPNIDGNYNIDLVVSDGSVNSNTYSHAITIAPAGGGNTAPVADPSASDSSGVQYTPVTLDGSNSTDVDGDTLFYYWAITTPSSSTFYLPVDSNPISYFTPNEVGTYSVGFYVNDGQANSAPQNILINISSGVANTAPVANAANTDTSGIKDTPVGLDGSLSSDADGDILTFLWTITRPNNGGSFSLPSTTNPFSNFTPTMSGTYTITLTVNDGIENSAPDSRGLTVTVGAGGAGLWDSMIWDTDLWN